MTKRVVIESPLAGDTVRNLRFLLWCCRAVWRKTGHHAIGSHLLSPWFMDDADQDERAAGIANPWVWDRNVPHWFFLDLGVSGGMRAAEKRCDESGVPNTKAWLQHFDPEAFDAFCRGEWPPHTRGFEIARPA